MRLSATTLLLGMVSSIFSQPASPPFAVASVKAVSDSAHWVNPQVVDPQRFHAITSLTQLILWAYRMRGFQILGDPSWLGREQFEIQAAAERPSSDEQIRRMLQELLADRFKLKLHSETREIPIYALVIGNNGHKLHATKDASQQGDGSIWIGNGALSARGATMALFVRFLSDNLDRPVLDKTSLPGRYDFNLTYDQSSAAHTDGDFIPLGPAVFGPIRDLGLKIDAQKDFVEMLVIDSAERPSAN
ncbi:MAG: TIGR03435 family protein [Acidobacteriia bacterium]|nr:TIGR03435 family protein [Terriglobia bacterium]